MLDWERFKKLLLLYLILAGAVMLLKTFLISFLFKYIGVLGTFINQLLVLFLIIMLGDLIGRKLLKI